MRPNLNQNLTWKIYKTLFKHFFISKYQWLWLSLLFIVSTKISHAIFLKDVDRWQNIKYASSCYYYFEWCVVDLIVITVLNMIVIYQLLPLKDIILNYFKNVENSTAVTSEKFLKASLLIFASIIIYLFLPQLIWPFFEEKISLIDILVCAFTVICFTIYNAITPVFIEVTFHNNVKTKLNLFIVNLIINYNVLSLILSPNSKNVDLFINYIILIFFIVVSTFYNFFHIFKKIELYKSDLQNSSSNFCEIVSPGIIVVLLFFIIAFKIIGLILTAPHTIL